MESIELQVESREVHGKQVEKFRNEGKVPAVLYGHGIENSNLSIDEKQFEKVFNQAGTSSLIDLKIDGKKPVKVLIQDIQRHAVSDDFLHVDFHQIKMTEKLSAEIELKFVGESKAVKEAGGILIKNLSKIKIECLPENLVHEIEVSIEPLATFDNIIRVKDLKLPAGIEVKEKDNVVVVNVQPPRTEEELKSLEETPEEKVDDVEKSGKPEKDEEGDEESKEGEAGKEDDKKEEKKDDDKQSK